MYTPLNSAIFQAAFAGAYGGMNGTSLGNGQSPTVVAGYSTLANIALAFAESYDTNRGNASSTSVENDLTQVLCEEAWRDRNPFSVTAATTASTWTGLSAEILAAVAEGALELGTGANPLGPNFAFIAVAATTNGQGVGGPSIVAMIQLVSKYSGIFDWTAYAEQAAAAATEAVEWQVTTQTAAAPPFTFTGGTAANGGIATGAPPLAQCVVSNGVAGTPIVITAGGGGELVQAQKTETIGTAAVGSSFGGAGVAQNAVGSVTVPNTSGGHRFPQGNIVTLCLKIANSATNRVVGNINLSFGERVSA
jgi:hypothetical protein